MDRALALVEKAILYVLMGLMAIVLVLATLDLIWTIGVAVSTPPFLVVTLEALLDIFGMFLLVLVGLELLDTIKAYVKEHVVHAEIVLLAALIAVARKAITLDLKQLAPAVAFRPRSTSRSPGGRVLSAQARQEWQVHRQVTVDVVLGRPTTR